MKNEESGLLWQIGWKPHAASSRIHNALKNPTPGKNDREFCTAPLISDLPVTVAANLNYTMSNYTLSIYKKKEREKHLLPKYILEWNCLYLICLDSIAVHVQPSTILFNKIAAFPPVLLRSVLLEMAELHPQAAQ